jgi:hypothetical protein
MNLIGVRKTVLHSAPQYKDVSMQSSVRAGSFSLSLLLAIQQTAVGQAQKIPEPPRPRMNVAVVEGEGVLNNVRESKPNNVVVIVRDGNRKPIPNASVSFSLPADGPGGTFADGGKALTITSDKDGYATARGLRPNNVAGPYRVQVEATHDQETATATVTQFNTAVESRGGSGKWIAIIAVIGAAAAGVTVAATQGGGNGAPAAPPPTPIGITAGSGSVGPPR